VLNVVGTAARWALGRAHALSLLGGPIFLSAQFTALSYAVDKETCETCEPAFLSVQPPHCASPWFSSPSFLSDPSHALSPPQTRHLLSLVSILTLSIAPHSSSPSPTPTLHLFGLQLTTRQAFCINNHAPIHTSRSLSHPISSPSYSISLHLTPSHSPPSPPYLLPNRPPTLLSPKHLHTVPLVANVQEPVNVHSTLITN